MNLFLELARQKHILERRELRIAQIDATQRLATALAEPHTESEGCTEDAENQRSEHDQRYGVRKVKLSGTASGFRKQNEIHAERSAAIFTIAPIRNNGPVRIRVPKGLRPAGNPAVIVPLFRPVALRPAFDGFAQSVRSNMPKKMKRYKRSGASTGRAHAR